MYDSLRTATPEVKAAWSYAKTYARYEKEAAILDLKAKKEKNLILAKRKQEKTDQIDLQHLKKKKWE